MTLAVTFDFGQVLAELDPGFLAVKLAERGVTASPARLDRATGAGWVAYGAALRAGGHGAGAWKTFMSTVLTEAGAGAAATAETLDFLFDDQRVRNLWRRPVPGMIELARSLRARGVPVGVVSNSEGALLALIAELGWSDAFLCVADSGALGLEKPGRAIFDWAAARLGTTSRSLVHVGDSYAADVEGALGAGARAVWFAQADDRPLDPARVRAARDADEARAALLAFGVPA
ncbi:MAG: HAD family hydrolase [Polyangiaceae bacterium]|nr:HAD family hydrolase [Polyangiaceae bacterium]